MSHRIVHSTRMAALLIAIGIGWQPALKADGGHDLLTQPKVSATLEFALETENHQRGTVTVIWNVMSPTAGSDVEYKAEITSTITGSVVLSLYNIGLQGRACDTVITAAEAPDGSAVAFAKDGTLSAGKLIFQDFNGAPVEIGKNKGNGASPERKKIGYIRFSGGKCTVQVISKRKLHSPMPREGHETTPPPPNPGGNDGEN